MYEPPLNAGVSVVADLKAPDLTPLSENPAPTPVTLIAVSFIPDWEAVCTFMLVVFST